MLQLPRVARFTIAAWVLLLAATTSAYGNPWEYGVLRYAPTELSWQSPEHDVGPLRSADRFGDAIRSVHGLPIGEEEGLVYVLNVLGQYGWELVGLYQNDFFFKRPWFPRP